MVRDPEKWPYLGYVEIQRPKARYRIINYQRLMELMGMSGFEQLQHRGKIGVTSFFILKWIDDLSVQG